MIRLRAYILSYLTSHYRKTFYLPPNAKIDFNLYLVSKAKNLDTMKVARGLVAITDVSFELQRVPSEVTIYL